MCRGCSYPTISIHFPIPSLELHRHITKISPSRAPTIRYTIIYRLALQPTLRPTATISPSLLFLPDTINPHLRQHSNALNLHIRPQRQLLSSHTSPARLRLTPILLVNLIHSREVLHVIEEHIHLDDVVDAGARSFEDCCQVLDALVLSCLSMRVVSRYSVTYSSVCNRALDQLAGGWIHADRAGAVD